MNTTFTGIITTLLLLGGISWSQVQVAGLRLEQLCNGGINAHFNILEIEAFDSAGFNHALQANGAVATSPNGAGFGGPITGVHDGDKSSGCCGHLWHSNNPNNVQVDVFFATPAVLSDIFLHPRRECCPRMSHYRLTLFDANADPIFSREYTSEDPNNCDDGGNRDSSDQVRWIEVPQEIYQVEEEEDVQLTISKTARENCVGPGGEVVFDVEIANLGTDPAFGTMITDTLGAGLSFSGVGHNFPTTVGAIDTNGNVVNAPVTINQNGNALSFLIGDTTVGSPTYFQDIGLPGPMNFVFQIFATADATALDGQMLSNSADIRQIQSVDTPTSELQRGVMATAWDTAGCDRVNPANDVDLFDGLGPGQTGGLPANWTGADQYNRNGANDNGIPGSGLPNNSATTAIVPNMTNADRSSLKGGNNFTFRFESFIYLDTPGVYLFGVNSDDGSWLYVDGEIESVWNGCHGSGDYRTGINTTAGEGRFYEKGWHHLEAWMREGGGGEFFEVHIQEPGGTLGPMNPNDLYLEPGPDGYCPTTGEASAIDGFESVPLSATASILVCQPDLVVTKTVDQTETTVGSTLSYTVTVANNGTLAAENVVICDSLPPGTTFVPGSANMPVTVSGGQVKATIPMMEPCIESVGESTTFAGTFTDTSLVERRQTVPCNGLAAYRAAVIADGAIRYFQLEDTLTAANNDTIVDSSPSAVNGTEVGGGGADLTTGDSGQPGISGGSSAFRFTGADSNDSGFTVGSNPVSTGPISLEVWVQTSITQRNTRNNNSNFGISQWFEGSGLINAEVSGADTTDFGLGMIDDRAAFGLGQTDTTITSGTITDGKWHHVVGVWDQNGPGHEMKLYIDGRLAAYGRQPGGQDRTAATDIIIGEIFGPANGWYQGIMDEVAIYNTALTAAQVSNHYNLAANICDSNIEPIEYCVPLDGPGAVDACAAVYADYLGNNAIGLAPVIAGFDFRIMKGTGNPDTFQLIDDWAAADIVDDQGFQYGGHANPPDYNYLGEDGQNGSQTPNRAWPGFPWRDTNQFAAKGHAWFLVDDPAGSASYEWFALADDWTQLTVDGTQLLQDTTWNSVDPGGPLILDNGFHYLEFVTREGSGGDDGELAVEINGGPRILQTAIDEPHHVNTGTYSIAVTPGATAVAWRDLLVNEIFPDPVGASITYTICAPGGTPVYLGPVTSANAIVDMSTVPAGPIEIKMDFAYTGTQYGGGPLLESWEARYFTTDCEEQLTFQVDVGCAELAGEVLTNLVDVSTSTSEIDTNNNSAAVESMLETWDLSIAGSANPPLLTSGGTSTVSITVENVGTFTSGISTATATIPPSVMITSIDPACSLSGSTVTCQIPNIDPGMSITFDVAVEVGCCLGGLFMVPMEVGPVCPDIDPSNNTDLLDIATAADSGAPTIVGTPPDLNECNVSVDPIDPATCLEIFNVTGVDVCALPAVDAGVLVGDDNCSFTTARVDQVTLFDCVVNIVRTWTLEDECGNDTVYVQDINISVDAEAPAITPDPSSPVLPVCLPGPITDEWTAGAAVVDNCAGTPMVSYTNMSTPTACGEVVQRTWTAVDECGNTNTAVQIFTNFYLDTAAPSLVVPAATNGCNLDISVDALGMAVATETCSDATITWTDTVSTVGCTDVIERVWTAIDSCGNITSATQTIENLVDTTPPVITLPPDTNGCAISTDVADTGSATAMDACGGAVTITNSDMLVTQGGNTIVFRTWIATDACGNTSDALQTIISLDDFGGPAIAVPPNVEACNGSTNMADTGMPMISPSCCATGSLSVLVSDSVMTGTVPCEEVITRTWVADDGCGTTNTASQIITNYTDTTAPLLIVPGPTNLCNGDTSVGSLGMAIATDDCLLVTNIWVDTVTQSGCTEVIERVWTATDFCGNTGSATQIIFNVIDTDAPVLTVPADTNGCNLGTDTASVGMATASDACGDVTVTNVDTVVVRDCVETTLREWIATDACGNSTSAVQVISVVLDTVAPALTLPADAAACNLDTNPASTGVASATDACALSSITFVDTLNAVAGCTEIYDRVWTATDACGNTTSGVQQISVTLDTDAPAITSEAPDQAGCLIFDTSPAAMGQPSATDNCASNAPAFEDVVILTDCQELITRTWTITDGCGNETSQVQVIANTIDVAPPVFVTVPDDLELCAGDTSVAATGAPQTFDACGTVTLTNLDIVTSGTKGDLIERVWTATDPCGNASTATQTVFNYTNTTPPDVSAPANDSFCNGTLAMVMATGPATSSDPDVVITEALSEQLQGCTRVYTRTFTATDGCLTTVAIQVVSNTVDSFGPVISAPGEVAVCGATNLSPSATGMAIAMDGCGEATLTWADVATNASGSCSIAITREWTAVDECGNTTTVQQVIINSDDTLAPVFSDLPQNVEVCNVNENPVTFVTPPTVTDDCDFEIEIQDNTSFVDCGLVFTRRWIATDECGNSDSAEQVITIFADLVTPVLFLPEDVAGCNLGDTSPAATSQATADSGCGALPTIAFTDRVITSACDIVITRTWTATDDCGNVGSGTQTIVNTVDTTAPSWDFFPSDTNVCNVGSIDPLLMTPTATDDCGVTVELTDESQDLVDCNFVITRTWTASDACGNRIVGVHTVVAQADLNGPAITLPPDVEACNLTDTSTTALGMASAVDGCSAATVAWSDTSTNVGCNTIITRTWTAIDQCDQVTSADQTIVVINDTTPPVIEVLDENICFIGTAAAPAPAPATATDACGDAELSATSSTNEVGCETIMTIEWTATDGCGNTSVATQTISVTRDARFGWDTSAASDDEGCNLSTDVADSGEPVVSSDCGATASFEDVVSTDGCLETTERTWTVTDICGTDYSFVQTLVSTVDQDAPILALPEDAEGCNIDPSTTATGQASATDACGSVLVEYADTTTVEDCVTTIARVWTATDACGNTSSDTQTVSVTADTQPPSLSLPENVSACMQSTNTADTGMATASDGCGNVEVSFSDSVSVAGVTQTVIRTWKAVDDCGNVAEDVQTIVNIDDSQPPVIDTPDDIADCNLFLTGAAALASASDNSGESVTVTFTDSASTNDCVVTITRMWMAVDACGNMATSEQTIENTLDDEPPALTIPEDISGCNILTGPGAAGQATATDNCNATVTFSDEQTQSGCTLVITRTWTATDDCGHAVSDVQTITVTTDLEAPTLSGPTEVAVAPNSFGNLLVPDLRGSATMDDNCGATLSQSPAPGTVFGNVDVDNFQASTMVSLTATDGCGNETTVPVMVRNVSCIGDLVFNDLNGNGSFDDGEPGVSNVTVTVSDNAGVIGTTTTDADGRYIFFMDVANRASVARGTAVGGPFTITAAMADGSEVTSILPSLNPGEHNLDQDLAVVMNSQVKGTVWNDLNADGTPEGDNLDALGFRGVTVILFDSMSNEVDRVSTGDDGTYCFEDVSPGEYFVGLDDDSLPDVVETDGVSLTGEPFTLTSGQIMEASQDTNFGFMPTPTAIELASIEATSGTLSWTVADESEILGYNVIDLATGENVNERLILAVGGDGTYSFSVGEGRYALESVDTQLNTDREAEITQYQEVDGSPTGDPTRTITAENGTAQFVTDEEADSYLVTGVGAGTIVLDVTDPDDPIRILGEQLSTDSGMGIYFSYPAGATISVR